MKNLLYCVIITILFNSCNLGTNAIYKSDNIKTGLKTEIESLNKKFIKSLTDQDETSLRALLSTRLRDEVTKADATLNINDLLKAGENFSVFRDYEIVDEFLVKGTVNTSNLISSPLTSTNDYNLNFMSLTEESYVSLVKMKGKRNHHILLLFIYGKYKNDWKINILHMGEYSRHNQTAPYYYEKAKTEFNEGNLINSSIKIHLASSILKPAGQTFSYNIEKEVVELQNNIMNSINESYEFPIVLNQIQSKPEILNVSLQEIEDTFSPMIKYLTTINLTDTLQLRLENEKIREVIPSYLKGINQNNDFVYYRAFNEMSETPVESYGFVHRFK